MLSFPNILKSPQLLPVLSIHIEYSLVISEIWLFTEAMRSWRGPSIPFNIWWPPLSRCSKQSGKDGHQGLPHMQGMLGSSFLATFLFSFISLRKASWCQTYALLMQSDILYTLSMSSRYPADILMIYLWYTRPVEMAEQPLISQIYTIWMHKCHSHWQLLHLPAYNWTYSNKQLRFTVPSFWFYFSFIYFYLHTSTQMNR